MIAASVAALIAGTAVWLIVGVLMMMLKHRAEVEEYQCRIDASIPKMEVLKAINCCRMSGRERTRRPKEKTAGQPQSRRSGASSRRI